jgi:hypothetical protein
MLGFMRMRAVSVVPWLLPVLLQAVVACIPYTDIVRRQATTDLRCDGSQIEVQHLEYDMYEARGCSHQLKYRCYDASPPAQTSAQAAAERDYRCAAFGLPPFERPAPLMTPEEAVCSRRCSEAASACTSVCLNQDTAAVRDGRCFEMCSALEQGCVGGCLAQAR